MQILELTMGAERKRPAGQYATDTLSASVRIALHPGDTIETAIEEARRALEAALSGAPPSVAAATRQAEAATHRVLVAPPSRRESAKADVLRELGLRWDATARAFVGTFTEARSREIVDAVTLIGLVAQTSRAPPTTGG